MPVQTSIKLKLSDVSTLTGAGKQTVRDWVLDGRLKATQSGRGRHEWVTTRADLVDWLVKGGWTPQQIRSALLPLDGCIVLVGDPPGLEWVDANPVREDDLFGIGLSISTLPAKAVVVDFHGDRMFAGNHYESFSKRIDRPIFVGLVCGYSVTGASQVCDLVFDREMPASRVIAGVNRLLERMD